MVRTRVQPLTVGLPIAPAATPDRIPVPVILAIGAEAHVLSEAIEQPRPGTMRLVVGDGISHLLQGVEALWLLIHKCLDTARTLSLHLRRHVNQHQRCCLQVGFANRDQADTTTHRCPYQDRPLTPRSEEHTSELQSLR